MLEKDAEHMRLVGKLEGFVRRQNPDYKAHLHTFDLANQELVVRRSDTTQKVLLWRSINLQQLCRMPCNASRRHRMNTIC